MYTEVIVMDEREGTIKVNNHEVSYNKTRCAIQRFNMYDMLKFEDNEHVNNKMLPNMMMHRNALLSPEQYRKLSEELTKPARQVNNGRMLYDIGPAEGLGTQRFDWDTITGMAAAHSSMILEEKFDSTNRTRQTGAIPFLFQGFRVEMRDLASNNQTGMESVDVTNAIEAGIVIGNLEETLEVVGIVGHNGLFNSATAPAVVGANFNVPGNAVITVRAMLQSLAGVGTFSQGVGFNLTLNPQELIELKSSTLPNGGPKEMDQIMDMLSGGKVVESSAMAAGSCMLSRAPGLKDFELKFGVDLTTMDYEIPPGATGFVAFLTVKPIIRRPLAIVTAAGV